MAALNVSAEHARKLYDWLVQYTGQSPVNVLRLDPNQPGPFIGRQPDRGGPKRAGWDFWDDADAVAERV